MRHRVQQLTLLLALLGYYPSYVFAQQSGETLEEILVLGNRLDYSLESTPSPSLIYGKGYFQSFEPQAVGDMLKRISGVAFSGDIGEFDAPQLRGLGSQYTQVLINGRRIPGNSSDRTVLMDRIPAELIERIELIRSPTPDIDSQGIGGTLNLVLKDSSSLQGADWRLGGLYYPDLDPALKGAAAITLGAESDSLSYVIAANIQERLNPKSKHISIFDDEGSLLYVSLADDLRDSTDKSLQAIFTYNMGQIGTLDVRMAYLDNVVDEDELINVLDAESQPEINNFEQRNINQERLEFDLQLDRPLAETMDLQLNFSASQFNDDTREREAILEQELERLTLKQLSRIEGESLQLSGTIDWQLTAAHQLALGMGFNREVRDAQQMLLELEDNELRDTTPNNGLYRVEETRAHAYIMDTWNFSQSVSLEYGIRVENTELSQRGNEGRLRESQVEVNPSVHLLYRPNDSGQFRASLARTLRRPNFAEIIPFTNRDTPDEDQVTVGNPALMPEFAWGLDIGYVHRFDNNRGNYGINVFWRSIDDKIELSQIGEDRFMPRNIGKGRTWGLEFDFAVPFTFINRPEFRLIGNYVWLDSKIMDPVTMRTRQFNLQPNHIANIDLYHDVPALGLSHGISWQRQGSVRGYLIDEIKTVRYEANLEYFIEKRFGANLTLRLSINNILDARKREHGLLYNGLANQRAGQVDEVVFETEQADPVFFFTARGSF